MTILKTTEENDHYNRLSLENAPDILKVKEVCEILRKDRSTIMKMIHSGAFPAVKPAGCSNWIIPKDGIIEMLNDRGDE